MKVTYYHTPYPIVEALKLTKYRTKISENGYLLSSQDLRPYGIDKAIEEGAESLTESEAKQRIKQININ